MNAFTRGEQVAEQLEQDMPDLCAARRSAAAVTKHPYETPRFVTACNDAYHLAGLLKLMMLDAEGSNDWREPVLHLAYDIAEGLYEEMTEFNLEAVGPSEEEIAA